MHIPGWIYGITVAVTITIAGVASLSVSHKIGSNITRIAYALQKGNTKAGQSTCLNFHGSRLLGCNPQSAAIMENTVSQNLSPADPLALSVTRTNGITRLNVGLSTSVKDPSGNVKLGVSATTSYGGQYALSIIDSAPLQAVLPEDVNTKAQAWLGEAKPKTDWFEAVRKCEAENKLNETRALLAQLQIQTGKGVGRKLVLPASVSVFEPKNCFLAAHP